MTRMRKEAKFPMNATAQREEVLYSICRSASDNGGSCSSLPLLLHYACVFRRYPPCCSVDLLLVDLKSVSVLHVELLEVDVSFAVTPSSVEGYLEVFIRELY
jgi:hypothetical protein